MSRIYPISPETMREHRATWWVYAGDERIRKTSQMRGRWGHDVTCSCGWETKTGGAIASRVAEALEQHRWDAERDKEIAAAGYDPTNPTSVIRYYREVKGITL